MKKKISLFIVLIIICGTIFLGNLNVLATNQMYLDLQENADIDVFGVYVESVIAPISYSIDITWGEMEFTHEISGEKNWEPVDHTYIDNTVSSWNSKGNTITVKNDSNARVEVSFEYASETIYEEIEGVFNNVNFILPSAVGRPTLDPELSQNTSLTLSGNIESTNITLTKVGTITINLS